MQYPKHKYVRSQKLLKLVAGLSCQSCGNGVQADHSNWGGGKGRGIKADDNLVAALCQTCHYEIDQGKDLSKEERQRKWVEAHIGTVLLLCRQGTWPIEVPLPFVAEFE